MANSRIGGILQFKIDGEIYQAKGAFSYSIGVPKKEMIVGSDAVHGYKEMPQVPYIEGALTDTSDLDIEALFRSVDVTCTLELANSKVMVLEEAVFAGEGTVSSEEGEIEVRFEGKRGREVS